MDWVTASRYRLTEGKFEGETLRMVAMSERGLRYLYWLSGQETTKPELAEALGVYLDKHCIRQEIEIVSHLSGRVRI